jgi:hypothetical protein
MIYVMGKIVMMHIMVLAALQVDKVTLPYDDRSAHSIYR